MLTKSLSSPFNRARWTEQDARAALAALDRSGKSVRRFAAEQGLDPQRLYMWRRRLAGGECTTFQEVIVRSSPAASTIEVVLASGVVLRVPSSFDSDALARLLDVLARACWASRPAFACTWRRSRSTGAKDPTATGWRSFVTCSVRLLNTSSRPSATARSRARQSMCSTWSLCHRNQPERHHVIQGAPRFRSLSRTARRRFGCCADGRGVNSRSDCDQCRGRGHGSCSNRYRW